VQHFFELLFAMTEKELRARYKHTIFGFLWIIINPLLQMIIIGFVFTFFIKEPIQYYYFHLFIGLLIWNFFSLSLTKTTSSIVFERTLIKKARFPHAVIPLSIILSNSINFFLALLFFTVPVLFLHTLRLSSILFILMGTIQLMIFTVGISLLTTALNVRYRDVAFFVQALLIVWFYATPIIYSFKLLPISIIWLWRFNPLTSTLQFFQHGFLGEPLPGLFMTSVNLLVIFTVTILGLRIFIKESNNFDDWL
jgi:ABC-2 type transport system permease protein